MTTTMHWLEPIKNKPIKFVYPGIKKSFDIIMQTCQKMDIHPNKHDLYYLRYQIEQKYGNSLLDIQMGEFTNELIKLTKKGGN